MRLGRWRRATSSFSLACVLLVSGCARETRVVRYHPMLGGLPNAESGMPVVRDTKGYVDPTAVPEDKLVVVDPVSNKKTLTAKTGRHLMIHIYNALAENDRATFVEQILSKQTKDEFAERGLDPGAAFDEVVRRRDDVVALFNAMPGGEFTPGVYRRPLGNKSERLEVEGILAKDLTWKGMDMVMEKGNWKLRWFVE